MNKKNLILASVLAIFFTSTLVLLYLKFNKSSPAQVITPPVLTASPTIIPTVTGPIADSSGQFQYTNQEFNFSVSYPSNWVSKKYSSADSRIPYIVNPSSGYLVQFLHYKDQPGQISEFDGKEMVYDIKNKKVVKINGVTTYIDENFQGSDSRFTSYAYKIGQGEYIRLLMPVGIDYSTNTPLDDKDIAIARKIANSFKINKIILSPTTTIPANWKTYSDKTLGFSFQYPSIWTVQENQEIIQVLSDKNRPTGDWQMESEGCYPYVQFNITTNTSNKSLINWITEDILRVSEQYFHEVKNKEANNLNLGEFSYKPFDTNEFIAYKGDGIGDHHHYSIANKNVKVDFYNSNCNPLFDNNYIEQILSTFKFTD